MRKKIFLYSLLAMCVSMLLTSCTYTPRVKTADEVQKVQQESTIREAVAQIGLPHVVNFQEMKLLKEVIEARDRNDLICYCYLANEMNGSVGAFLGKCLGYGIPYATQFTNPQKLATSYLNGRSNRDDNNSLSGHFVDGTLPQADPNGLFSPASADATWIFLINPTTGEPKAVYVESKVIVSPFPLK